LKVFYTLNFFFKKKLELVVILHWNNLFISESKTKLEINLYFAKWLASLHRLWLEMSPMIEM